MKTTGTEAQLIDALKRTNKDFAGNVRFKRIEQQGRQMLFTLTVHNSSEPGARRGYQGQRVAAACWHVHGTFFDHLIDINPGVVIKTALATIDKNGGNWQDKQVGSVMFPRMYSEMCDC